MPILLSSYGILSDLSRLKCYLFVTVVSVTILSLNKKFDDIRIIIAYAVFVYSTSS